MPKNVETLLFLKYNLKAMNYGIGNLEEPPSNWVSPNLRTLEIEEAPKKALFSSKKKSPHHPGMVKKKMSQLEILAQLQESSDSDASVDVLEPQSSEESSEDESSASE